MDFADDKHQLQDKSNKMAENAGRLGLKVNIKKTKIMRINARDDGKYMNGETVEDVVRFMYLGAIVTKEGGVGYMLDGHIGGRPERQRLTGKDRGILWRPYAPLDAKQLGKVRVFTSCLLFNALDRCANGQLRQTRGRR